MTENDAVTAAVVVIGNRRVVVIRNGRDVVVPVWLIDRPFSAAAKAGNGRAAFASLIIFAFQT